MGVIARAAVRWGGGAKPVPRGWQLAEESLTTLGFGLSAGAHGTTPVGRRAGPLALAGELSSSQLAPTDYNFGRIAVASCSSSARDGGASAGATAIRR